MYKQRRLYNVYLIKILTGLVVPRVNSASRLLFFFLYLLTGDFRITSETSSLSELVHQQSTSMLLTYRAFQRFGQAKIGYGDSVHYLLF